jgi:hypothetical protein
MEVITFMFAAWGSVIKSMDLGYEDETHIAAIYDRRTVLDS